MEADIQKQLKKDTNWINGAKFIAICAVLVDHTNGILYTNQRFGWLSYFSVTAFVLLSGITSFYSNSKHCEVGIKKQIYRRIKGIFVPYAVAVLFYQIVAYRFWDLKQYIQGLFAFNVSGPFYFVVFYIQLMIVSPFIFLLIKKIRWGGGKQSSGVVHICCSFYNPYCICCIMH